MEPDKTLTNKEKGSQSFSFAKMAFQFGYMLAGPLIIAILVGEYLDTKYHTHAYLLFGILLAFVFSSVWIGKFIVRAMQEMEDSSHPKNSPKKDHPTN